MSLSLSGLDHPLRAILCALIAQIDILPKRVDMHLVSTRVAEVLRQNPTVLPPAAVYPETEPRLTLTVAAELKRAGMGMKLIIEPSDVSGRKARPDISLVKLILKAHAFNNQLVNGAETSLSAIARHEGLTGSYVTRLLRLSYLSPDITRAILDGRHPPDLTAAKLIRLSRLPLSWEEQKRILGFA